jgi:hypothetical protein
MAVTLRETSKGHGRLIAGCLALFMAFLYSGLSSSGYVRAIKYYLTPFDLAAAFCCAFYFLTDCGALRRLHAVLPFAVWAIVYFVWGLVVLPSPGDDTGRVINHLVVLPLALASAALALTDRRRLQFMCDLIQVVAIVNAAVCLLQALDPDFVLTTARTGVSLSDADVTYINFRPVGLWANQNQASRCFVYAMLLSFWARPQLAWFSRVACIAGIYLTASRFGAYMLVLNVLALAGFYVMTGRARQLARRATFASVTMLLIAAAAAFGSSTVREQFVGSFGLANGSLSRWARIADIEDQYAVAGESHDILTLQGLDRALGAPWYGEGLYTFQRAQAGMLDGTHNMYIAVWGETGLWGLIGYPFMLLLGVSRVGSTRMAADDRVILLLLWGTWLVAGFVSHVDLESPMAYVMWAMLFVIPRVVALPSAAMPSRHTPSRPVAFGRNGVLRPAS